ncbi:hypothetical protein [Paenibacillus soyae]|uniref:Uncharacterized protein n=1 Tax=Paenibacillus soyae TaxID=2969249 RepID=A0A9X2MS43_9BACL|nr:hypothetical protein [Paenibacillus soyae]MCR2805330.1 hypothetical protein [Paenibacillus soyae]
MLFVSAIEEEPGKPYLKRVTIVDSMTGDIAGVLHYGDSASDRHIRLMAPSLVRTKTNKRGNEKHGKQKRNG